MFFLAKMIFSRANYSTVLGIPTAPAIATVIMRAKARVRDSQHFGERTSTLGHIKHGVPTTAAKFAKKPLPGQAEFSRHWGVWARRVGAAFVAAWVMC